MSHCFGQSYHLMRMSKKRAIVNSRKIPEKKVESETVIKFDGQKQGNLSLAYLSSGVTTPHSDLTFYCRDGQVAGHRLVLASLSPFLRTLLQRHWLQVYTEYVSGLD